ncbi:MAG: biotin transporter BioY [Clostridiaceae bacterium]|nr:biotin transporter BioY [Clostridiaceae bacterium]
MRLSIKEMITTALFTALMVIGAFVRIPFTLLPITLQPFICALAALVLGPRLGALSMTLYTILGLIGVPVFTGGGGITYVFNQSFGFILGFIAGAYVIGVISAKNKAPKTVDLIKALSAGLLVIYAVGILYMFVIMRLYLGYPEATLPFVIGANIPYIIKDLALFVVIALIAPSILPRIKQAKAYL